MVRKAGRWLNPVTLMLAAFCFALPFVSVSCATPGGYAGAEPGGSSKYNGVALLVGAEPEVDEEYQRLVPPEEDDRLPPQPALAGALLALLAAAAVSVAARHARARRAAVAVLSLAGTAALLVGQVLAQAELRVRVSDHLIRLAQAGERLDPTKTANDYVQTGPGFVLCLALLVVVTVTNGIGWWRLRPRPALVAHAPAAAADPWGPGRE